jgi:hypothetical protein
MPLKKYNLGYATLSDWWTSPIIEILMTYTGLLKITMTSEGLPRSSNSRLNARFIMKTLLSYGSKSWIRGEASDWTTEERRVVEHDGGMGRCDVTARLRNYKYNLSLLKSGQLCPLCQPCSKRRHISKFARMHILLWKLSRAIMITHSCDQSGSWICGEGLRFGVRGHRRRSGGESGSTVGGSVAK